MIKIRIGKLADTLGVHRNTVRNWIKTGSLPARAVPGKKYVIESTVLNEFLQDMGIPKDVAAESVLTSSEGASRISAPVAIKATPKSPIINKEVPMSDKPVGSIMVVGAGITGIQASLDLADSGYFVYLLEKSPGIGGGMAKLDKTFPTNDCAM